MPGFVQNRSALWATYLRSKEYGSRPSELVGLDPKSEAWPAWCFDEACFIWGKHVEYTIREATKNAKNEKQREGKAQAAMRRLMQSREEEVPDYEEAPEPPKGAFRDPAARFKKG